MEVQPMPPAAAQPPAVPEPAARLGWTPLFSLQPHGVLLVDPTGSCLEANPAAAQILGLDRNQLLATPLKEILGEGSPGCGVRIIQRVLGQPQAADRIHWLQLSEHPGPEGSLLVVFHDITEAKLTQEALQESEFFFRESQRAAAIGSYKADFLSGFWTSSEVLDAIFGIDPTYVRSVQGWVELIHPEDRAMMEHHLQDEVIGARRPFAKQYRIIRHSDGEVRWVQGFGEGSFSDEGIFMALVGTIQDITEVKHNEEERNKLQVQLQQAQKMESLGTLSGGVAHDMNNVLGAILALASAHLELQSKDHPSYPAFETIRDAALRGGDMVKRLLTFARQNPIEKRELDLNALLLEEVRLLERTTLAKVNLELDLAPDLRLMRGDGSALSHAFMNLCVNAVDAMEEGGTLTFQTRNLKDHLVEVIVGDTGCGMTPDIIAKAMDPFFTTKEVGKGTGLGLSMVYTTVTAHGGQISLQSERGRGTTVRLLFPATVTQDLGKLPQAQVQPVSSATALGILLVDDDELIQKSTRMLIEILGHGVTVASCGEEALELIQQGARPDVVVLDMNMPGLGGKGTLPRLRDLCPQLPILLATGRTDQEALDLVANDPHVNLLAKPFSIQELEDALHSV